MGHVGDPKRIGRISALSGGILWLILCEGTLLRGEGLSAVAAALVLAATVVVPLGLALVAVPEGAVYAALAYRTAVIFQPFAAILTVVAFTLPPGPVAGALALGWLALTGIVALCGLLRFFAHGFAQTEEVALDVAMLLLPVGSGWLICSRAGLQPGGFSEPIITLTAAHFHYAGFGALTLAGLAGRRLALDRPAVRLLYRLTVAGIIVAIPLVALAISDILPEPPGAILLAISLVALSGLVATLIPRVSPPLARGLLIVSALAPLLPMALASAYALREQYPAITLTIAQMVRFHGLVNAIGFVLCGLLAWTISQLSAR
jgi:hypothetical protein